MIWEPFPQTSEWVEHNPTKVNPAKFAEYRWAVSYHLQQADEALKKFQTPIEVLPPTISEDRATITVSGIGDNALVPIAWFGDTVIRSSASALDAGLHLMNFVLGAPGTLVDRQSVRWGNDPKDPFRRELRKRSVAVDDALGVTYGSMGGDRLLTYRHWVTHGGAPIINAPAAFPLGVLSIEVPKALRHDLELLAHFVPSALMDRIEIACVAFVPPMTDAEIDEPAADGGPSVYVRGTYFRDHSHDPKPQSPKQYRSLLHRATPRSVAGRQLSVYTLSHYHIAVGDLLNYVMSSALKHQWDSALVAACQRM